MQHIILIVCIAYMPMLSARLTLVLYILKGNVAVYKDLNIEFVTKKVLSRERSVRMQLSHIAHVRIAYFTHALGMILYAMAIERVELQ